MSTVSLSTEIDLDTIRGVEIHDPLALRSILRQRRASGDSRWDEVWNGVYVFMPNPDIEHQDIATGLATVLRVVVDWTGSGKVYQGVNVSDRAVEWTQNFRCPDVAVYLHGNPAQPKGAFWFGGPDLAIEIVSPDDRARDKLPFYSSVGVRELLVIDRAPWALELHRRQGDELVAAGRCTPHSPGTLASQVLGLGFELSPREPRPAIRIRRLDGSQAWET